MSPPIIPRALFAPLAVLLLLSACSCSGKTDEESASETLEAYLDAELEGDREAAYALISTADKRVRTLEQYKRVTGEEEAMRERFAEHFSHEVVSVIVKGIEAEAVVKATGPDFARMRAEGWNPKDENVPLVQQFRTYTLVKEGENWRVDAGLTLEEVGRALVSLLESFAAAGAEGTKAVWGAWWDAARDITQPPPSAPTPPPFPGAPTTTKPPSPTPPGAPSAPPGTPPAVPNQPAPPETGDTPPAPDAPRADTPRDDTPGADTPRADAPPKATPPAAPSTGRGQWTQRRIRTSGRNGEDVFLTLRARQPINSLIPQTPVLDLRCSEGVLSIMIHTRTLITSDFGRFDEATVTVQLGQGEPTLTKVQLTEHHQTMVLGNALIWLEKLHALGNQPLRVTFEAPVNERHTMDFDMTGLHDVSGPLKMVCGLDTGAGRE